MKLSKPKKEVFGFIFAKICVAENKYFDYADFKLKDIISHDKTVLTNVVNVKSFTFKINLRDELFLNAN